MRQQQKKCRDQTYPKLSYLRFRIFRKIGFSKRKSLSCFLEALLHSRRCQNCKSGVSQLSNQTLVTSTPSPPFLFSFFIFFMHLSSFYNSDGIFYFCRGSQVLILAKLGSIFEREKVAEICEVARLPNARKHCKIFNKMKDQGKKNVYANLSWFRKNRKTQFNQTYIWYFISETLALTIVDLKFWGLKSAWQH